MIASISFRRLYPTHRDAVWGRLLPCSGRVEERLAHPGIHGGRTAAVFNRAFIQPGSMPHGHGTRSAERGPARRVFATRLNANARNHLKGGPVIHG